MMETEIFNDKEYQEILDHLNQLMQEAEELPYPNAKELIFSILKYFDSIHREPLSRMVKSIQKNHPELVKKLEADFPIKTMLSLYDLVTPEPIKEELEIPGMVSFIPVEQVTLLTPIKKTEWVEIGKVEDLIENKIYPKNFEKVNFLISKIGTKIYAIQNACVDSILPIDMGKLEDHFLICPWHGCRYDLKTGIASNKPEKKLETYPVEFEENGMLKVGVTF